MNTKEKYYFEMDDYNLSQIAKGDLGEFTSETKQIIIAEFNRRKLLNSDFDQIAVDEIKELDNGVFEEKRTNKIKFLKILPLFISYSFWQTISKTDISFAEQAIYTGIVMGTAIGLFALIERKISKGKES